MRNNVLLTTAGQSGQKKLKKKRNIRAAKTNEKTKEKINKMKD